MQVVQLQPDTEAQDAMVLMLEDALEKARSGELLDVGISMVVKPDGGDPEITSNFWGKSQFALLVASVAQLAFALQMPFGEDDD